MCLNCETEKSAASEACRPSCDQGRRAGLRARQGHSAGPAPGAARQNPGRTRPGTDGVTETEQGPGHLQDSSLDLPPRRAAAGSALRPDSRSRGARGPACVQVSLGVFT